MLDYREDQPTHVMPLGQVEDIGHLTEVDTDEPGWFTLSEEAACEGCYLCERGICVRRFVQLGEDETLIVHGAYEA